MTPNEARLIEQNDELRVLLREALARVSCLEAALGSATLPANRNTPTSHGGVSSPGSGGSG